MKYKGYYNSPLGKLVIIEEDSKVISVLFDNSEKINYINDVKEKNTPIIDKVKTQLNEYFLGKRKMFDLPIKFNGTSFQISVWKELQKIQFGKTCTYKDIAKSLGKPNACRAVGNANGKNTLVIIIPCHRVVSKCGIGGYTGGVDKKEYLLRLEGSI